MEKKENVKDNDEKFLEIENENKKLKEELEKLKAQNKRLDSMTRKSVKIRVLSTEKEDNDIELKNNEWESENAELKKQLAEMEKIKEENQKLRDQLNELKAQNQEPNSTNEKVIYLEFPDTEEEDNDLEKKNNELTSKNAELQKRLAEMEKMQDTANKEMELLRSQIKQLTTENTNFKKQLDKMKASTSTNNNKAKDTYKKINTAEIMINSVAVPGSKDKIINKLKRENEKLKQKLRLKPISVVGPQQNKNNGPVQVSSKIDSHDTTKTPSSVKPVIADKINSLVNDSLQWCSIEQFDNCFRKNKKYDVVRESNKLHGQNKLNCKSITDCKNFADIYSYLCILGYNDKPKFNNRSGSYTSEMTKKDGFKELCKKVFNVEKISDLEAQKQSAIETIGTLMCDISLDETKESKLIAFTKLTNEELENDKRSIEKALNAYRLSYEVEQFLKGNQRTNASNTRGKIYLPKINNCNKRSNNKGVKYSSKYASKTYKNSTIAKK